MDEVWKIAQDFGYHALEANAASFGGKMEKSKFGSISKIDNKQKTLITIDFLLVTEAITEVWQNRKTFKLGSRNGQFWFQAKNQV